MILLTGGSGFIGKSILDKLEDKYQILAPSHQELDLTDFKSVAKYIHEHKIKKVIHSTVGRNEAVFKTTLQMFINLTRNLNCLDKIIHFGSGAEYAKTRDIKKIKESQFGQVVPEDDYGLAKYICSLISKSSPKVITLRLFGVYGKNEDYRRKFISNAVVKNLLGLPIKIKQNVVFDYLYIDDLIQVVDHFLSRSQFKFQSYNVAPDKSISLIEIADLVNRIAKKPVPVKTINPGLNYEYTADNSRLKQEMSNFKFTSYENGLKILYKYYSEKSDLNKQAVLKDKYFTESQIKKTNS